MRYAFFISSTGDTNLAISTIESMQIKDPSCKIIIIPLTNDAAQNKGLRIFSGKSAIKIKNITDILEQTEFKKSLSETEQTLVHEYLKKHEIVRVFIGVASPLDEKTPYQLADCFVKNPDDAIPHVIAYEYAFKAPAEHPVWLLKPAKNRSISIPLASAKEDFPDFNTHIVSHQSFYDAIKTKKHDARKFLNRIALDVIDSNEFIFVSGTTQKITVDTSFLDSLLKEMSTGNHPGIAIRFGLHPGVRDIDTTLEKLLAIVDRYPQTQTAFKIILTDEIASKIKNAALTTHPAILRRNISGDDAAMTADKVAQAVPGALVNKAALIGKKVFLDPTVQAYLSSDNFVTSISDFLSAPHSLSDTDEELKSHLLFLGSPAANMADLVLAIKEKKSIANLSSLIHTKKTTLFIPSALGHIAPTIQNEWPSIVALFDLYNRFMKYRFLNFSKLFTKTYNMVLLAENFLKCSAIEDYKKGTISTNTFLQFLLNKEFSFLKLVDLKNDAKVVAEISARKNTLLTTYELTDDELLDNTILAKALLEIAWIERLQFHDETKTHFDSFMQDKQSHHILISDSNPMDIWQTVLYLKKQFPSLQWHSEDALFLQINNHCENAPIELANKGRLLLYASYRYGVFKAEGLLKEVIKNFPHTDFKLISQSEKDLEAAKALNIPHQHADDYFEADGARKQTLTAV